MSLVGLAVDTLTEWIGTLGYPGIFLLMLLESVIVPIPSEVVMVFAGTLVARGRMEYWGVVIAGSLGSLAGAHVLYWAGRLLGRPVLEKHGRYVGITVEDLGRADMLFEKHGRLAVFLGRLVPGVRSIVSIPAGVSRMRLLDFTVFTFLGSAVWCGLLVQLGVVVKGRLDAMRPYFGLLDVVGGVAAIAFLAALLYGKRVQYLFKTTVRRA